MYPSLRNLFVQVLGHQAKDVLTDSRTDAGVRPDVAIAARTPAGQAIANWIVVEAKDEDVFSLDVASERIIKSKWRYVTAGTEWFVCVDPITIRIRRVTRVESVRQEQPDQLFTLSNPIDNSFLQALGNLSVEAVAGRQRLLDFRIGKPGTFGRLSIEHAEPRRLFLDALKDSARYLSSGVAFLLEALKPERASVRREWETFHSAYPSVFIKLAPFRVGGVGEVHNEERLVFRSSVARMRELYRLYPVAFQLEVEVVEAYRARAKTEAQAEDLLKEETAALLLSRILMLRFFEDYGYFGPRRYLCNGGVAAFQHMREYMSAQYPEWLRKAYEAGGQIYQAVFDTSPLDWVLKSSNLAFSDAIEQTMLLLSVFNFTTIEEELLSAIYGTFFDDRQRKSMGEHYTPPSVARWIVRRVRRKEFGKVLDPACGFGTFLVESYLEFVGKGIRKGVVDIEQAGEMTAQLCGNDKNFFSGTIAQMQMLWNILNMPDENPHHRLPKLNISSGFDSLTPTTLYAGLDEMDVTAWSDIDGDKYQMVVGNPPYVRPERREAALNTQTQQFFQEIGSKSNIYGLFIYKALGHWLVEGGRLGFVIPLTFVDTSDSAKLRSLFRVGGPWKIVEIVDMEEMKRAVFPTANVRPIILIAENTPATAKDRVTLRFADPTCILPNAQGGNLDFDLDRARTSTVAYESIWSDDGRLLTRMTEERSALARKLSAHQRWRDIARRYWDRKEGARIVERSLQQPSLITRNWEEKRFLTMGCAARGADAAESTGPAVYKGENILPCQITGDPVFNHVDPLRFDDPSIWRFPKALPPIAYAFSGISMFPVGVGFDPANTIFFNTATLFVPAQEYDSLPFDLLALSAVYRWFYAVYLREGVIADFFSHAYTGTIGGLPWTEELHYRNDDLERLRERYLAVCRRAGEGRRVLAEQLAAIGLVTLKERVESADAMRLRWGSGAQLPSDGEVFHKVWFGPGLFDYVEVNDASTAEELAISVRLFARDGCTRDDVRDFPLPAAGAERAYNEAVARYESENSSQQVEAVLSDLDDIVASAFSVSPEELDYIRRDLREDGLLARLVQRRPYQEKTMRGLLSSLASRERYQHV